MHYIVIEPHRSEYPRPLRFARGTLLEVGPRYESGSGLQDWYLCCCTGQEPGWVPEQIIERLGVDQGKALDHYCAHELDVEPGQLVQMLRPLNGWLWCRRHGDGELGWLPASKLQQLL
nr:SH3 domain-containing protein [uncultured Pseudomonas sp.]